ncbi:glutamate receptor ionotropic, delta-2-like [Macrobrachium rosenbergii]|uniref:glutamate receptor ionotropic, delta-2-like n=1 Tax=Macrobrachium rosenbergii TaxID=79674 RepID=UPI0034D42ED8
MEKTPAAFVSYDVESFTKSTPPEIPVYRYRPSNTASLYCVTFYILAPISQVERALETIPKTDWFSGANRYFVIYTGVQMNITDMERIPSFLKAYNTLFVSANDLHTTAGTDINSWPLHLFSTCPFCRSGEPEIILGNRWSPKRGLMRETELFPDLFRNCNGHVFRGVTLSFPPFMHYTEGNATHRIVLKDCLDRNIMRVISRYYNFSFDLYEPADGQWGYQLDNGSFTGVLGVVQRYEADFSMDISITAEREEVIDFTIGFHSEPLSFVTSKPQPLPQWLALVRPYKEYVWICFIATVAAAGPVYWFLHRLAGSSLSLFKSSFQMFASLFNQSLQWPQKSSVRIFSLFWILFSLLATVSYVCNLTAFLTVPALSPTVDNLEDLSHSSFVWGINDYGAADYQLFKTSKAPLYQRIFRGLTFCPSLVECVQRTLDRRFAFISWRTYLRDVIAMNFTDKNGYTPVYLSRESFWPGDIGYAMQKGSPFRQGFNKILRRLIEGGLMDMWVTDLIQKHTLETQRAEKAKAAAKGESDGEVDSVLKLTLYHLQGVFFIYGVGLFLSAFALFLELIAHGTSKIN